MAIYRPMQKEAQRVLWLQFMVTWLMTALWSSVGFASGFAALLGGLACLVPNGYMMHRIFNGPKKTSPKRLLQQFYAAELAKIGMSVCCFIIAIKGFDAAPIPFFASYAVAQLTYFFALLPLKRKALQRTGSQA